MTPSSLLAEITHKPAVAATLGVMVLALVAILVISVLIKRRRVAAAPLKPVDAHIESTRIQRATSALLPDDMHQRLRYLTADLDAALPDQPEPPVTAVPRAAVSRSGQPDDTTQHFGSPGADLFDRTTRFQDSASAMDEDATRFFGSDVAELEDDAPDQQAPGLHDQQAPAPHDEHVPASHEQTSQPEPESGTAFFGLDDDAAAPGDAAVPVGTQFFSPEELEIAPAAPTGTQLFSSDELALAPEVPSGTQYFAPDELDLAVAPSETHHFAPEELEDDAASQTHFFGDADPDADFGGTGMLRALPPMTSEHPSDGAERQAQPVAAAAPTTVAAQPAAAPPPAQQIAEAEKPTGPLPALPPSQQPVSHATLESVREKLASVDTPEVLALSVIDGSGRVLAGEADDDLTGELRSLMAESGQGNAADVDQPVRLGDESAGALLLLPTGANALLGALVREDGDADHTRSRLRGLAQDIGETMRRAS